MAELYVGLMSGTSMDAVDAVLVDFSSPKPELLATHSVSMPEEYRETLLRLIANQSPHPLQCYGEMDHLLGKLFARATNELLDRSGYKAEQVRAIGSHGQTVYHQPGGDAPFTLQIGDPNIIAHDTGITTIADFRRMDMAAGGQGAPLVPAFHEAIFRDGRINRVILNIGGMANITVLPADPNEPVTGFDTGPGNVLMDLWVRKHKRKRFDRNGKWAASGKLDSGLLERMLADPYFNLPPPKSTGREYFNHNWLEKNLSGKENAADVQHTLTVLTATTIADAISAYAHKTQEILICGGGINNMQLLATLTNLLPQIAVRSTARYGLEPQWIEAITFAWLAYQRNNNKPGNLTSVTGARQALVMGGIYPDN